TLRNSLIGLLVQYLLIDCYTGNSFLPGAKILPSPSNLNYSLFHICTLNWTWNPPENISSSCNLEYSSAIIITGAPDDRGVNMHLNEEMRFRVRSECKNDSTSEPSPWVEISLLPKGILGSAAVDLSCVWHNLEYMACTWRPGENASSDTNYTLSYWFDGLEKPKKCINSSVDQGIFECIFNLTFPNDTRTYPDISILISSDSEEIRPVCKFGSILLCLRNFHLKNKYTFKVRAKPKWVCYNSNFYSDWSEETSIGQKRDSTTYFVLIITIPLIIAVSTVILLVYLKRLKILILPPIPDPREILKRMFGEQNEDSQVSKKLLGNLFLSKSFSVALCKNPKRSTLTSPNSSLDRRW
uniref:Interleukin 13 receptor subunit alpha 1 n=1 Tax=Ficedula albicollis TaxID=59894 RepID=A0A803W619_FICAL